MKNKFKRLFTFFLALICIIGVTPTTAYAATTNYHMIEWEVYYENQGYTFGTIYPGDIHQNANIKLSTVKKIVLDMITNYDGVENQVVNFSIVLDLPEITSCNAFITDVNYILDGTGIRIPLDFHKGSNSFDGSYVDKYGREGYWVLVIENPVFKNPNAALQLSVTTFKYTVNSEQTNFFNDIKEWFKSLFELLTSKFAALGDSITNLKNSMAGFFNSLGDRISGFFTNLGNDIKDRFTELKNNLSAFFSDVGDWFSNLGDRISGFFINLRDSIASFFEKLWNRIWWGNENGESEYNKPVINNKLSDILATLSDYQEKLKDTIDTIGSAADEVSTYIATGTQLVNGVINVAGGGITALIVFGMVFVLVRKVVGR